ncbi:MAG: PHP domain-containing protein, partial [Gammaproteobacteria bacterium]|nr:PHP domain-containing protein [Gammaproteobacteria bacterium]
MSESNHTSASVGFVHLHLHSEYSLRDGLIRLKPLVKRAAELNMPAVAVTDLDNLFAAVKFYKGALEAGVKPILGCDLAFRSADTEAGICRVVLLAMSATGYRNLSNLITAAYRHQQPGELPMVDRDWMDDWSTDLIAISAGLHGDVGQVLMAGKQTEAQRLLDGWLRTFGDRFYLGVSRTGRPNEERCLQATCDLAIGNDVPVVAGNDVRFLVSEDFEAHEARVCIHEGRSLADPRRPRLYSEQQYLRSPEEMRVLFADLPGALQNSVEIARRCNVELQLGKNFLPEFPVPAGQTVEQELEQQSRAGLERRLSKLFQGRPEALQAARP